MRIDFCTLGLFCTFGLSALAAGVDVSDKIESTPRQAYYPDRNTVTLWLFDEIDYPHAKARIASRCSYSLARAG